MDNTINLQITGVKNVPVEKVVELLQYLHSYYREGMSVGCAYDDMAHLINHGTYMEPRMARSVLDGAKAARNANMAHIQDLIFFRLRDFFEETEFALSE